mmetsp:Transcript_24289/g.31627  ORF Transcript_24289/g.31627 Transcript_24289/m.31627 type:complete len:329 (+) Transcript_24289:130-1116(+)
MDKPQKKGSIQKVLCIWEITLNFFRIPRLLKRLVVICFLVKILSNDLTSLIFPQLMALFCVICWFCYDGYRCEQRLLESQDKHRHHHIATKVMSLVCDYDPQNCISIQRFQPVLKGSRCLFAKSSKIWGSRDYLENETLESNVQRSVPMLLQMLLRGEDEGIDGFLFEIRSSSTCSGFDVDVDKFADAVRRVLCAISDLDPTGERSARKSYIADRAWHFVFAGIPIFVTTFAPCYDKTSSRYAYGIDSQSAFVLLQPEYSFLYHDIPFDTPETDWENPKTIRDRIRKSFADAGQKYLIPETTHYPASEHIVKSLDGASVVKWWERPPS